MPIRFEGNRALFEGDCAVDEAAAFAEWLEGTEAPQVDLGPCTRLHTALVQLLLVARPEVGGEPRDPFLRAWLRLG